MPNVCVPGILGVLAWDDNFWGFATAPVQKLGSMNGFRLQSLLCVLKKSRVSFLYPPKAFLETRKPCFQLGVKTSIPLSGGKTCCFSGAALLLAVATWQFTKFFHLKKLVL